METKTELHLDLDHLADQVNEVNMKQLLKQDETVYLKGKGDWQRCYDVLSVIKMELLLGGN